MRIIQMVGSLSFGDAIGNYVVLIDDLLKNRGYTAQIYADFIHPKYHNIALKFADMPHLDKDDVIIYHMCASTPMNQVLRTENCRKILMYHNVTPPQFFQPYDRIAARSFNDALKDVRDLRPYVDACIAISEFNKRDLMQMGYDERKIWVIPSIFIPFADYAKPPAVEVVEKMSDGWTNILFVGRIAPNKKHEDIIRAYAYYKRCFNPRSRLILVGSEFTPSYSQMLTEYIKKLGVSDVIFPGHISFAEIIAYYKTADVFLCMSEHEGFCVPLIEAMFFEIPIVAYAACAIPDTLGGSGILLDTKDPAIVARIIEKLRTDRFLKTVVVERQRARLNEILDSQDGTEFLRYLNDFIYNDGTSV